MRRRKREPRSAARQRHEPSLIDRMRPGHWVVLALVLGGLVLLVLGQHQRVHDARVEADVRRAVEDSAAFRARIEAEAAYYERNRRRAYVDGQDVR